MKEGTKYLITIFLGVLAYFAIILLTPLFSLYRGFAPLNAQAYHEGVTSIVISIILLGIVICCCTYEIVEAIKKHK